MPVGSAKNLLYGLALPILGKRCRWRNAVRYHGADRDLSQPIARVLKRHHVVGGCVQVFRNGQLAEGYTVGMARLTPDVPVSSDTYFRTASIAKMACALLVMRLQTLGKLDVEEDISAVWGKLIRNPAHPDLPISLATLMSHTSGIVDSPRYFQSFQVPVRASDLLTAPDTYASTKPGERFRYSNFAAGFIGCLLEQRFGQSLESLMQQELFTPLHAQATFDISTLGGAGIASAYRVFPPMRSASFDAPARFRSASPLDCADPETHYQLASGSLFITAEGLARLCLPLITGGRSNEQQFLNGRCLTLMTTPTASWPEPQVRMRHGMGLLEIDDPAICSRRLHGHQGFAYGAVNGVFFDDNGNGFTSLNSGASEKRIGHLSCLNRDLITVCMKG